LLLKGWIGLSIYIAMRPRYTAVDFALLGVTAVVMGILFTLAWTVYEVADAFGGPIVARALSYGLWFIGAPLGATLVKKPLSGFLGETLGALLESLLPTIGGTTNLIYGVVQGALSELAYLFTGYKRFDAFIGALAGALAGPGAVALDAILFDAIAEPPVMLLWLLAASFSGALYGGLAALAASTFRG